MRVCVVCVIGAECSNRTSHLSKKGIGLLQSVLNRLRLLFITCVPMSRLFFNFLKCSDSVILIKVHVYAYLDVKHGIRYPTYARHDFVCRRSLFCLNFRWLNFQCLNRVWVVMTCHTSPYRPIEATRTHLSIHGTQRHWPQPTDHVQLGKGEVQWHHHPRIHTKPTRNVSA